MNDALSPREDYLQRLGDVLPTSELARVREDVDALLQDHAAGVREEHPELDAVEAERRAVAALGSPERLAEELGVATSVSIPLNVRRAFVRALCVFFAGHLLLSIVLTVAGSDSPAIPGLLMPLPKGPALSIFLSVLTIFLIDAGAILVLFAAMGARRTMPSFPKLGVRDRWTRHEAIQGLLLVGLLAVLFNAFLDPIFSVKQGPEWIPFLSRDLMALVPFVNIVLGFLALRHILTLTGKGGSALAVGADALAALSASILLTVAAVQGDLVTMPDERLGPDAAGVLDSLIERVFLLIFIVAAIMLMARFVRQVLRLQRMART